MQSQSRISLIPPNNYHRCASLNSRWKPTRFPKFPLLAVSWRPGINPEGGGNGAAATLFSARVSRVNAPRARKERGDPKQIRVTRVMKGWRKTVEEGEALMENIRGVLECCLDGKRSGGWFLAFPDAIFGEMDGMVSSKRKQRSLARVPPIILFHARRPFCFVVISWLDYSRFLSRRGSENSSWRV